MKEWEDGISIFLIRGCRKEIFSLFAFALLLEFKFKVNSLSNRILIVDTRGLRSSRESVVYKVSSAPPHHYCNWILFPIRLSNLIQGPSIRHYISSRRESRSLDNSSTIRIFPWILDARIYNLFENPQPDASNQTNINSLLLLGNISASSISRTEEDISSLLFCWSGDTRIWTGEKGFAVPRLTTRPCRQNDRKYMKFFP